MLSLKDKLGCGNSFEILIKLAGLRGFLLAVLALVIGHGSIWGHEINLSDAHPGINPDGVNDFDFQGPGRVLANQIAIFIGGIAPTHIAETGGDMGIDAETANGTAAFKHGDIFPTRGGFNAASQIQLAGCKYQAAIGDLQFACRIFTLHVEAFPGLEVIDQ